MVNEQKTPGKNLTGQTISGKWEILELIDLEEKDSTGGCFCIPYFVKNTQTNEKAFLKVFDVVKAIQTYNDRNIGVMEALKDISSNHSFESELLKLCNEKKFKRIVQALDSGEINVVIPPLGEIGFPYLIFELGDGDTYSYLEETKNLDNVWWISTMHQACLGVRELHSVNTSHQDLKPSNVVFFGMDKAKLADLGRAAQKGNPSKNDRRVGDNTYAPFEYLYGYTPTDWDERYLSIDLFMLGGLAFCGYSDISLTWAVITKIPTEFHPRFYSGQYEDVIPVIEKGFAEVMTDLKSIVPKEICDLFIVTIQQLCNPDPAKRGHPKNHIMKYGGNFSLERYVSAFSEMLIKTKMSF